MIRIPPAWIPETLEIYKVPLQPFGRNYAYMSLHRDQREAGYRTVLVDKDKFLAIWDKHNIIETKFLENDRKLPLADIGFSRGPLNPVPMAEVGHIHNN